MELLTLVATIAGILSFVYLAFIGQRSLLELWRERKADKSSAVIANAPAILVASEPSIPHNLPYRSDFVGREKEKRDVHEALRSRSYLVAIDGIGGIGKTSLAREVVQECLIASQKVQSSTSANSPLEGGQGGVNGAIQTFSAFIWTSAKDHELTLNDVLDTIAFTLDYSHLAQLALEEKRYQVMKRLQEKSCLLVVDNFETITDQRLHDFLQALPEPSKCLVTSRTQNLKQARAISIRGLAQEEAQQLIQNESSRLGLNLDGLIANEHKFAHFYEATGGAPLAIRWATGQIKQHGQTLEGVLNSLHGAQGDIFEFIFQRAWSLLTEPARNVLLIMPIFASSASRAAIEAASEVHKWDLDEGLGQLVELWLLEASDDLEESKRRYSLHPLTRAFAQSKLAQQPELERSARVRLAEFFTELAKAAGGDQLGAWERYDEIAEEDKNIFGLINWCFEKDEQQTAIQLIKSVTYFINIRGYYYEGKIFGYRAVEYTRQAGKFIDLAWLLVNNIGLIESHGGDLDMGEKHIREGLKMFESLKDSQGVLIALLNLSVAMYLKGDFKNAQASNRKGLSLAQANGDDVAVLRFKRGLFLIDAAYGNLFEAQKGLESILPFVRKNNQLALSGTLANLAEVNLMLGRYETAQEYGREALAVAKRMKRRPNIAWISHILSKIEAAFGNYQSAIQLAEQALDFYESSKLFTERVEELRTHIEDLQKKL